MTGVQTCALPIYHRNPVAVLVPCHRVVGKNGSLTGYAGGLDVKEGLLALEKRCGG